MDEERLPMDSTNGVSEFPTSFFRDAKKKKIFATHQSTSPSVDNATYLYRRSTPIGCRSSANYVWPIMAKFDDRKRELVRSIGFGGLLELHDMTKVNRVFSHWLLSVTNWEDGVITASQHIKIKIVSEDIEKILGIPARGKDILASAIKEEEIYNFLQQNMSFLGDENTLIDTAEKIIEKELDFQMSKQDEDQFKIAFVVFIMGRFLAPTTMFHQGNYNFWHALVNPDEIKDYNWSEYVLRCLLDSARVLFFGSFLKKPPTTVTGCPLVLQIFYLDNIDLGPLNMRHDVFPRIKAYDCSVMSRMINADTDKVSRVFGCSKLRRREDSCYALPDPSEFHIRNGPSLGKSRPSHFQKKRRYHSVSVSAKPTSSTDGALLENTPIISRCSGSNFPAYIRSKYPEYVEDCFIEALRYHNAKCIQQINKHKAALTAAIVAENMALADKYVQQHQKNSDAGIPKYPRKGKQTNRKNYDDFLSGPESGTEAEEQQDLHQVDTNNISTIDLSVQQGGNSIVDTHGEFEAVISKDVHAPKIILYDQSSVVRNKDRLVQPSLINNTTMNNTLDAGPSNAIDNNNHDSLFQTPAAISKMPPLTPQLSPTEANRMHSDYALTLRMLSSWVDMDLNTRPVDAEYNNSLVVKKVVKIGRFARSHWCLGVDHPERDPSVTGSLYEWVSTTNSNELDRPWIIHDTPRYIVCKGHDLKKEFFYGNGLSYDLFDICIRRLIQLDNQIYPPDSPLRWRHFLESDFAMHVLGGEKPSGSKSVRDQFLGPGVCSELHRCRMFFIPVQGKSVWWCYAIDLRESTVFIIDPCGDNHDTSPVLQKHCGTITMILDCLKSCIINLFDGWQLHSDDYDHVVVKTTTSGCSRSDSAFYTLYCMKNFDGDSTIHVSESIINKFKQSMMYELFGLKDNRGNLPSVYVQTIDD